jgi:hypothetical protein
VVPVAAMPNSVVFDPGRWILGRHSITNGIESEIDPTVGVSRPTLHPVAPNPVREHALVRFSIPNAQNVTVQAIDATGRAVRRLWAERAEAGYHTVVWDLRTDDGRELPAGVYVLELEAGADRSTRKIVLK